MRYDGHCAMQIFFNKKKNIHLLLFAAPTTSTLFRQIGLSKLALGRRSAMQIRSISVESGATHALAGAVQKCAAAAAFIRPQANQFDAFA